MNKLEEKAIELYPLKVIDDTYYDFDPNDVILLQRESYIKGRQEEHTELINKIKEYFFNIMDKDAYKNVSEQFYEDTVKFIFSLENVVKSEEQSL